MQVATDVRAHRRSRCQIASKCDPISRPRMTPEPREGDSRKLSGDPGNDGSVPIVTQIKGPTAHVRPAGALRIRA
jgi:hypothetical protein